MLGKEVTLGRNVLIGRNCHISGKTIIWHDVILGDCAYICDSIVGGASIIGHNSSIVDSVIGANNLIGADCSLFGNDLLDGTRLLPRSVLPPNTSPAWCRVVWTRDDVAAYCDDLASQLRAIAGLPKFSERAQHLLDCDLGGQFSARGWELHSDLALRLIDEAAHAL